MDWSDILFEVLCGILIVIVLIVIVRDILHARKKKTAPGAVFWAGTLGFDKQYGDPIHRECLRLKWLVEGFLDVTIKPVVVVLVAGPIVLSDGSLACGKYHTAAEWDHPWIEISTGFGDFAPKTIADTAFEHELFHHATAIGDTSEFRALWAKYCEWKREKGT